MLLSILHKSTMVETSVYINVFQVNQFTHPALPINPIFLTPFYPKLGLVCKVSQLFASPSIEKVYQKQTDHRLNLWFTHLFWLVTYPYIALESWSFRFSIPQDSQSLFMKEIIAKAIVFHTSFSVIIRYCL